MSGESELLYQEQSDEWCILTSCRFPKTGNREEAIVGPNMNKDRCLEEFKRLISNLEQNLGDAADMQAHELEATFISRRTRGSMRIVAGPTNKLAYNATKDLHYFQTEEGEDAT